jgi:hypothetical protein
MNNERKVIAILIVVVLAESVIVALPYLRPGEAPTSTSLVAGAPQTFSYSYPVFDRPISNDTDAALQPSYPASWEVNVYSTLSAGGPSPTSEAQLALAPSFRSENLSIPTIVIQERADGLLRVEYFAQNWNNTYGLVLVNSTSPSWMGQNVTLRFVIFGPPSQVDPQIAPRPNGNLTILVGTTTVLSAYPVAWASMAHIYLYGLRGSSFVSGKMEITFNGLSGG